MTFILEKATRAPEDILKVWQDTSQKKSILAFIESISNEKYLYWDKVKHKEPSPKGISKELLWSITKIIRSGKAIATPVKNVQGDTFTWSKLTHFEEMLHTIDMHAGGELFVDTINKSNKQKFITRGLIEEAIASSQLEGAETSRPVAKRMLREGRAPTSQSEQMILNNYLSMQAIETKYKDATMSKKMLIEIHSLITKDTLDAQGEVPRIRKKNEPICVSDPITGKVYHDAPNMDFVESELKKFIDFSNDTTSSFIHPIIKAIILHFWIGYLHPFTDGNGRLARIIFYWYLIKKDYWAFAYLPISKAIKESKQQYAMAYVYSEQDDTDLTYFVHYNLKKIQLALQHFQTYLKEQSKKNVRMKNKAEATHSLNIRQVQLLQYLHGDTDERTNLKAHKSIHHISTATAASDLNDLVSKRFLLKKRTGRNIFYYPTPKIKKLF